MKVKVFYAMCIYPAELIEKVTPGEALLTLSLSLRSMNLLMLSITRCHARSLHT